MSYLFKSEAKRHENGDLGGFGAQFGLNETHEGTNLKYMTGRADVGWGGDGFRGFMAELTGMGGGHDPAQAHESGLWGGIYGGSAGIGAFDDRELGFGMVGAFADALVGEIGYRNMDPDSRTDRGLRVGGSWGAPGGSVRWYNQDVDGDGVPEQGLGVSVPVPVPGGLGLSFDYTSETPVGDLQSMGTGGEGLLLNAAMDWVGLGEQAPGTLAQDRPFQGRGGLMDRWAGLGLLVQSGLDAAADWGGANGSAEASQ